MKEYYHGSLFVPRTERNFAQIPQQGDIFVAGKASMSSGRLNHEPPRAVWISQRRDMILTLMGKCVLPGESITEMFTRLYEQEKISVARLARDSGGTKGIMRNLLEEAGFTIRSQRDSVIAYRSDPQRRADVIAKIHKPESRKKRLKAIRDYNRNRAKRVRQAVVAEFGGENLEQAINRAVQDNLTDIEIAKRIAARVENERVGRRAVTILRREAGVRLPRKTNSKSLTGVARIKKDKREIVQKATPEQFDQLADRELTIINLRHRVEQGQKPKTLKDLGNQLGITGEWVRQIEKSALKKLASP